MKDHSINFKNLAGILIYASTLLSVSAQAAILYAGDTATLSGTTAFLRPEIAGTILEERVSNFAIEVDGKMVTGAVSLRLRDFLDSRLLIDYRITSFDDQGLGLQIQGLSAQDFFPPWLDVDYRLDEAGDVSPVTTSRQLGIAVEFDFGSNPLVSGETSRWMFVGDPVDDLVVFGPSGSHLLVRDTHGGQFSIPFDSYDLWIPIPASLPIFVSGLIGLIGIAKCGVR